MSKVVYLNAGHGNFDGKKYHTFPSDGKYYSFADKKGNIIETAYEGFYNRIFAEAFFQSAKNIKGLQIIKVYDPIKDMYNYERVAIANRHFEMTMGSNSKNALWLSFHSNAHSSSFIGEGTPATGLELWTSQGYTLSDVFAKKWCEKLTPVMQNYTILDRGIKEANFTELVFTSCPAVLIENLFFTNKNDVDLLKNKDYQIAVAEATKESVIEYFNL